MNLTLPFQARGHHGEVRVSLVRNDEPHSLGCDDSARDFPVCTADVNFSGRGYTAVLGWVQFVGEAMSSADRPFLLDPLQLFEGVDTPYGWHGLAPTLFDAPSRRNRELSLDWLALSFLCFSPRAVMGRDVAPLIGFSWGFTMASGEIDLVAPAPLTPADWDARLPLLSEQFPSWQFLPSGTDAAFP